MFVLVGCRGATGLLGKAPSMSLHSSKTRSSSSSISKGTTSRTTRQPSPFWTRPSHWVCCRPSGGSSQSTSCHDPPARMQRTQALFRLGGAVAVCYRLGCSSQALCVRLAAKQSISIRDAVIRPQSLLDCRNWNLPSRRNAHTRQCAHQTVMTYM